MVVASFHLMRFPARQVPRRVAQVPIERHALACTDGVRFSRWLGTGAGRTMTTSADLRRWAAFMVWDSPADLADFVAHDPRRWTRHAVERYDLTLQPTHAHGAWSGRDPLGDFAPTAGTETDAAPIAVLTRATVHWRQLRPFLHAVAPVDAALDQTDGLLATVGIGEVPVGQQATFSLWRDPAAIRAFAYDSPIHADVVRRTRSEQWYREEWFARFRVVAASGTWGGVDPLG